MQDPDGVPPPNPDHSPNHAQVPGNEPPACHLSASPHETSQAQRPETPQGTRPLGASRQEQHHAGVTSPERTSQLPRAERDDMPLSQSFLDNNDLGSSPAQSRFFNVNNDLYSNSNGHWPQLHFQLDEHPIFGSAAALDFAMGSEPSSPRSYGNGPRFFDHGSEEGSIFETIVIENPDLFGGHGDGADMISPFLDSLDHPVHLSLTELAEQRADTAMVALENTMRSLIFRHQSPVLDENDDGSHENTGPAAFSLPDGVMNTTDLLVYIVRDGRITESTRGQLHYVAGGHWILEVNPTENHDSHLSNLPEIHFLNRLDYPFCMRKQVGIAQPTATETDGNVVVHEYQIGFEYVETRRQSQQVDPVYAWFFPLNVDRSEARETIHKVYDPNWVVFSVYYSAWIPTTTNFIPSFYLELIAHHRNYFELIPAREYAVRLVTPDDEFPTALKVSTFRAKVRIHFPSTLEGEAVMNQISQLRSIQLPSIEEISLVTRKMDGEDVLWIGHSQHTIEKAIGALHSPEWSLYELD